MEVPLEGVVGVSIVLAAALSALLVAVALLTQRQELGRGTGRDGVDQPPRQKTIVKTGYIALEGAAHDSASAPAAREWGLFMLLCEGEALAENWHSFQAHPHTPLRSPLRTCDQTATQPKLWEQRVAGADRWRVLSKGEIDLVGSIVCALGDVGLRVLFLEGGATTEITLDTPSQYERNSWLSALRSVGVAISGAPDKQSPTTPACHILMPTQVPTAVSPRVLMPNRALADNMSPPADGESAHLGRVAPLLLAGDVAAGGSEGGLVEADPWSAKEKRPELFFKRNLGSSNTNHIGWNSPIFPTRAPADSMTSSLQSGAPWGVPAGGASSQSATPYGLLFTPAFGKGDDSGGTVKSALAPPGASEPSSDLVVSNRALPLPQTADRDSGAALHADSSLESARRRSLGSAAEVAEAGAQRGKHLAVWSPALGAAAAFKHRRLSWQELVGPPGRETPLAYHLREYLVRGASESSTPSATPVLKASIVRSAHQKQMPRLDTLSPPLGAQNSGTRRVVGSWRRASGGATVIISSRTQEGMRRGGKGSPGSGQRGARRLAMRAAKMSRPSSRATSCLGRLRKPPP